jgi:hypothetical protein
LRVIKENPKLAKEIKVKFKKELGKSDLKEKIEKEEAFIEKVFEYLLELSKKNVIIMIILNI